MPISVAMVDSPETDLKMAIKFADLIGEKRASMAELQGIIDIRSF
jgi:hypothetical protein